MYEHQVSSAYVHWDSLVLLYLLFDFPHLLCQRLECRLEIRVL